MNADFKRVRHDLEDGLSPAPKRRAVGLDAPPSVGNGDEDGIEDWMKVVEVRRKEAIYRQMLEYRRSYEREAQKVAELETQRRVLEASVHAVEVCWTQVVSAIQDFAGRQERIKEDPDTDPILDPLVSQPELEQALHVRSLRTRRLLEHFNTLATRNELRPASTQDLQSRCLKFQTEATSMRSSSHMYQSQVTSLTESRDTLQRDLLKAQKALDRQRMDHDKLEQDWKASQSRDRQIAGASPVIKAANGSGHATPNGKIEEDEKPVVHEAGPSASSFLQDTSDLEQLNESRSQQLEALRSEFASLRQETDRYRLLALNPSESALRESPFFQIYLHQLASHANRANSFQERSQATERKLDELRSSNFDFREAVLAESRMETDALRQRGLTKDADLARLRGQRDDITAELSERRMRETDKLKYADEMEALAAARQDRISLLSSEVRRLKGQLGAESGAEGYLEFLKGDGGIDGNYVRDLEAKLASASDRISALAAPQVEHVTIIAELEAAKRSVEYYQRVLGSSSEVANDVKELGRRLDAAEKEKRTLLLRLSEAEAATNALYSEVEGLSKLWEGLEHKVHSKVFELKDGEMKMARLATEKAKADNKYFQAMRAKEAIEGECKNAQRSVEKQLKLLERAQEVERGLGTQIATQEKALTAVKKAALDFQAQLASTASEKSQLEIRLQQSQMSLTEAQQIMHQRVSESTTEKAARERLQEEVDKAATTIKKLKERQEVATLGNITTNELQMKEERDKLLKLLRCNCCEQNFKQQVVFRCGHAFCKTCLDDRVNSRQRKCPACGMAFAKEDIQTIYW